MGTEYIERGEAIEALKKDVMGGLNYESILKRIPSADVQPIKHCSNLNAAWSSLFECSICHWKSWDIYDNDTAGYDYCPNCGAKIDLLN